jgi:hypothetical protein
VSAVARIVIAATDNTAAAFKSASAGLAALQQRAAGIGSAFAGRAPQLAAAFSVGALTGFVRGTINALDALNDVADATGSTVESLSALEDVARRNGGTLDDVAGILVKFNAALNAADGKNDVSRALEAIGLNAQELRKLDPAQALQATARALAGFADDGNKARIVQELFGKSIREAAPFLKDLAEAGELNARVTSEQAAAAERFNKQMFAVQASTSEATRALVSGLLPAIEELINRLRGVNTAFSETGGLSRALLVPFEAVAVLGVNVAYVFKQIGNEIGGIAAQAAALLRLDFGAFQTIGEELRADAVRSRAAVDERTRQLLGLAAAQRQLAEAQQATYSNEGRNFVRRLPSLPRGSQQPAGQAQRAPSEMSYEEEIAQAVGRALDDNAVTAARKFADQLALLDRLFFDLGLSGEFYEAALRKITKSTEATGEAGDAAAAELKQLNELLAATPSARLEATRAQMLLLTRAFTDGVGGIKLSVQQYEEAVRTALGELPEKVKPALDEMSEFAKQFERNIQDSMGETIKRTLAGDFKSIGRLWGNLLLDMAAQAIAVDLGNKLFPKGGGGLLSFLGGLFGFAKGAPFANGLPVTAFASGGVVSSPSVFPMRGSLGLMGEAGPEAIMPLKRGRDGRLGVEGGGGVTNITYNVAAGVTRNELVTALQVLQSGMEARMTTMLRRQGIA